MKWLSSILFFLFISFQVSAQSIYYTETGEIDFTSTTVVAEFTAKSNEVLSFIDIEKGEINFSVLIESFDFKNDVMQKQFVDYYIKSKNNPRATFTGEIIDFEKLDLSTETQQPVKIKGRININGENRIIEVDATLQRLADTIFGISKFTLLPSDFGIKIPRAVRFQIAKNIEVSVATTYLPYPAR